MSTMMSTVLEIEREAEAVLAKAEADAAAAVERAKADREDAAKAHVERVKQEIAGIEAKAAADRDARVRELTASGEVDLDKVRSIPDAAFDKGVQYVMEALGGNK